MQLVSVSSAMIPQYIQLICVCSVVVCVSSGMIPQYIQLVCVSSGMIPQYIQLVRASSGVIPQYIQLVCVSSGMIPQYIQLVCFRANNASFCPRLTLIKPILFIALLLSFEHIPLQIFCPRAFT